MLNNQTKEQQVARTAILLVDKHAIVREGLRTLLQNCIQNPLIEECTDGTNCIEMLGSNHFDIVILDLDLPRADVPQLIVNMIKKKPMLKIIIFTEQPENVYAVKYFKSGIYGYVSKSADLQTLTAAILCVAGNDKYASPAIKKMITFKFVLEKELSPFENLTDKEVEVTRHLMMGKRITDIAQMMSLHTSTIGTHKSRLFRKLNIRNVVELRDLFLLHNPRETSHSDPFSAQVHTIN